MIYPPASYCHNAIGGVREWTGVYVFYQIAEQESWQKGQLLCSYSRSWTNNHGCGVEKSCTVLSTWSILVSVIRVYYWRNVIRDFLTLFCVCYRLFSWAGLSSY